MRSLKNILILMCFAAFSLNAAAQKSGKEIFENRCTACHRISNSDLVGPGLAHINKRRDQEYLINFIRHSQDFIASGNETAKKVYNEYNQNLMPPNEDLSDQEIINILNYIKEQSKDVAEPSPETTASTDKKAETQKPQYPRFSHLPEEKKADKNYKYNPDGFDFQATFWIVAGMVILAVLAFTWMVIYFSK